MHSFVSFHCIHGAPTKCMSAQLTLHIHHTKMKSEVLLKYVFSFVFFFPLLAAFPFQLKIHWISREMNKPNEVKEPVKKERVNFVFILSLLSTVAVAFFRCCVCVCVGTCFIILRKWIINFLQQNALQRTTEVKFRKHARKRWRRKKQRKKTELSESGKKSQ